MHVDLSTDFVTFCFACALLLLYVTPWLLGWATHHPEPVTLAGLNLFFGWTVVGWFLCFVWAIYNTKVHLQVWRNGQLVSEDPDSAPG